MSLRGAAVATVKSRRFWLWELAGVIIYSIPVAFRFATKNVNIPILNFPGFWIWHFIPGNFLEKLIVNAFFPGGAGGIAGETFVSNYKGEVVRGKTKYLSRLAGALLQTTAWSAFQYWGYSLLITGPYGGNVFEHAIVFPINFTLAVFSIFTPDVVSFVRSMLKKAQAKIGLDAVMPITCARAKQVRAPLFGHISRSEIIDLLRHNIFGICALQQQRNGDKEGSKTPKIYLLLSLWALPFLAHSCANQIYRTSPTKPYAWMLNAFGHQP